MGQREKMRSRKNNMEEAVDTHRWVISYADFITLLFAFFVVMYAVSSVNVSKYKSLSEGMQSAFNQKDKSKTFVSTDDQKDGPNTKQTQGAYQDGLDELSHSLAALESTDYQMNRQKGWIELQMKAGSLFDPAGDDLKPEAILKLLQLAGKITKGSYPIIVEGYTDDVPITSPQYPSNWDLSAARAAIVGRFLNSFGVAAERITVTGYGEQYPVMDNTTEWGRSQNRRVNVLIVKDRTNPRVFNPSVGQVDKVMVNQVTVSKPAIDNKK